MKAFELSDYPFRKVVTVTDGPHLADQFFYQLQDLGLEGDYARWQLICLDEGETCYHDRDFHRLLLQDWHDQGLVQDLAQLLRGIVRGILAFALVQVRMQHVVLDGPGRTMTTSITRSSKNIGLQSQRHAVLRAALNLKTQIVSARDIVAQTSGSSWGNGGQSVVLTFMQLKQHFHRNCMSMSISDLYADACSLIYPGNGSLNLIWSGRREISASVS